MKRRDYESFPDIELSAEDAARFEAAIAQADRDVPPTRGHDLHPHPRARMLPAMLLSATFLTAGLLVGLGGVAPWWGRGLLGILHVGLLVGLRVSLQDQFLALSFGVDAVIRERRTPEVIVVISEQESRTEPV